MKSYIPDYPRPQFVRESWENLNGTWNFAFDDEEVGFALNWKKGLPKAKTIQVPFTYETKASGIGDETVHGCVWYSRSITLVQEQTDSERIFLHFEGSDYQTTVWVNGVQVGTHMGGYSRFSFDISHAVTAGENIICVQVRDSLNPRQPRGKQRWRGENFGCWYVQTTGIWKTVWLETVAPSYIKNAKITSNVQAATAEIEFDIAVDHTDGYVLETQVSFGKTPISTTTTRVLQKQFKITVDMQCMNETEWGLYLWTPETPNLYDVEFRLLRQGDAVDTVKSYFGMREIRIDGCNILLNGTPLYQRLILDQGYWKDSHLTPPSEAAVIEDIEKIQQMGYNGIRKHQKTEDERFLYWCDVKGLLVWGEMASFYAYCDEAVEAFTEQWIQVVRQNYNHPCIITWTPINESWGVPQIKTNAAQQCFTQAIYYLTKSIDATRPVIVNDGWEHTVSDIITLHDYEEDGHLFSERYLNHIEDILNNGQHHNLSRTAFADGFHYCGQPIIISEFGGIAYNNDDSGWGYGNKVETEQEFLTRFNSITTAIKKLPYCCGFCYTQVTDVQQEINGLMDIERNFKVDSKIVQQINMREESCVHRICGHR
ncbi:MAG: glycoside hydrolase family 2 TIM barrel-domain containing protein [Christensenella sp.]